MLVKLPLVPLCCRALVVLSACSNCLAGVAMAERAGIFGYDAQAALDVRELASVAHTPGVVRHEITFTSDLRDASAFTVTGTLLVPERATNCAGVLWVHWLGEPASTNRTEFLIEAETLAASGVVSLLVDTMWARPRWYRNRVLDQDYAMYVRQVVELRRALDLLAARPEVDASRLALVGHDYGAMHGLIAAALDARVKTCVLIAATPSFNDWAFYLQKPANLEAYLAQMAPLDLLDYATALEGRSVFLQFAREDFYVPIPKADKLYAACREPRQMKIYDGAGHDMTAPAQIRADRTAWLQRELGLRSN